MKVHKDLRIRFVKPEDLDPEQALVKQETYIDDDGNERRKVKLENNSRFSVFEVKDTDGETVIKPKYDNPSGIQYNGTSFLTGESAKKQKEQERKKALLGDDPNRL